MPPQRSTARWAGGRLRLHAAQQLRLQAESCRCVGACRPAADPYHGRGAGPLGWWACLQMVPRLACLHATWLRLCPAVTELPGMGVVAPVRPGGIMRPQPQTAANRRPAVCQLNERPTPHSVPMASRNCLEGVLRGSRVDCVSCSTCTPLCRAGRRRAACAHACDPWCRDAVPPLYNLFQTSFVAL